MPFLWLQNTGLCHTHDTLTCDIPKDFLTPITGKCLYPEDTVIKSMEGWTPWPHGHRSLVWARLSMNSLNTYITADNLSKSSISLSVYDTFTWSQHKLCLKTIFRLLNPTYKSSKHDHRNLLLLFPKFLETHFFQVTIILTIINCWQTAFPSE